MAAQYIIRADDASEYMNHEKWSKFESICKTYFIKPIVAVIPFNEDKSLKVDKINNGFWGRMREWQDLGWSIALHGCTHELNINKSASLVPVNNYGEFAGVEYSIQRNKIIRAINKFKLEKILPKFFVAPAHSFDENTCKILNECTEIKWISDGMAFTPYCAYGLNWLPQQLWKFEDKSNGVWTICFHPNEMSEVDFENLKDAIEIYKDKIVDPAEIISIKRKRNVLEIIYGMQFYLRRFIWRIRNAKG